jgi:hypothetical protein
LRQQKTANMFLLNFADFAEIQQTANLLMKTLIKIYFKRGATIEVMLQRNQLNSRLTNWPNDKSSQI